MKRKVRKLAAVILAAALFLQNGAVLMAEEGQPEGQTEAAQTEAVTEAPTEKVTEAPTEKVTEAPTEKVTEAPTEKVTEAPTEKATEAPTEKPAEAPSEKTTEAPAEKPAEAPSEKQTEAPSEKADETSGEETDEAAADKSEKKKKKKAEKQTERSERENDGEKVSSADILGNLQTALQYLFAAETVNVPAGLSEGQMILSGSEGAAAAGGLKEYSVKLANAKSSSDVKVINVYADEDGSLDTAQLKDAFDGQVIDVTKQYCVVNVIADSADQALQFSGYEMSLSGAPVSYADGTECGDILYNFAAMDEDGEKFTGYTGNLSLSGADRLQGTFLAPQANVTLSADLAGAVFAGSVTVADSVTELLQISFVTGRQPVTETEDTPSETADPAEEETGTVESGTEESNTEEPETEEIAVIDEGQPVDENSEQGGQTETGGQTTPETQPEKGTAVFSVPVKTFFDGVQLKALANDSTALPYITLFKKTETAETEETGEGNPETGNQQSESSGTGNQQSESSGEGSTGTETAPGGETSEDPLQKVTTKQPVFAADADAGTLSFEELAAGTYVLKLTDAAGAEIPAVEGAAAYPVLRLENGTIEAPGSLEFTIDSNSAVTPSIPGIVLDYGSSAENYPSAFYYEAVVSLTKRLMDSKGNARKSGETFYAGLFEDEAHTKKLDGVQIVFNMNDSDTATVESQPIKVTKSPMTYYVAETDKDGNVISAGEGNLNYAITLEGSGGNTSGAVTVNAKAPSATAVLVNQLSSGVVRIAVVQGGQYLKDVTLVIKNSKGNVVKDNGKPRTFNSRAALLEIRGLPEGDYYLSEITAPSGCAPAEDVPFKVEDGKVALATIENVAEKTTDYALTVNNQVYSGDYQVYARTDSTGTYENDHTFYVALFKDADHKIKVSNVQKIKMSGLTGSTTFKNLKHNSVYYLAETNEYGEPVKSGSSHQIRFANEGRVTMDARSKTAVMQNVYSSLPRGYRYTGTLTITKRVTSASGAALSVSDTFYVGIYRTADYSDKPTIVSLAMNNKSSASARRRILLSGNNDVTYYLAEVDANGNRLSDSSSFKYTPSIDQPTVTISRGDDKSVTVTNQEKSSKVTLYLTMRVYDGAKLHPVTQTFYAGLFRDPQFTKLYTRPVPMSLNNQSELTLKLSLNLGSADKATIYIAEVDQNGNVIRNESQFGYSIRVVNSTAVFTREANEIQTIFLNSVYGSTTDDDWKQILSDENNIPSGSSGSGFGYSGGGTGWVGGNGEVDPTVDTNAAQTGDETPIGLYVGLLVAAVIILILLLILRRRKNRK